MLGPIDSTPYLPAGPVISLLLPWYIFVSEKTHVLVLPTLSTQMCQLRNRLFLSLRGIHVHRSFRRPWFRVATLPAFTLWLSCLACVNDLKTQLFIYKTWPSHLFFLKTLFRAWCLNLVPSRCPEPALWLARLFFPDSLCCITLRIRRTFYCLFPTSLDHEIDWLHVYR